jgi:hypothetical protein
MYTTKAQTLNTKHITKISPPKPFLITVEKYYKPLNNKK